MSTSVRIIAQHYDNETGKLLKEITVRDDEVKKPEELKDLGYLHMEQIDIMSKCQDFRVSQQIILVNNTRECPICGSKTLKHGKYDSEFTRFRYLKIHDHHNNFLRQKVNVSNDEKSGK